MFKSHNLFIWTNIVIILGLIIGKYFWDKTRPEDIKTEIESLPIVYPDASGFSEKKGSPPHYEVYVINEKGEKELAGLCFLSTDFAPSVRGYAGKIKMLIGVDKSGKVAGVKILSHNETPSYVLEFQNPDFFEQFKKLDYKSEFKLGKDIDGITRATVTSEAIARALKESVRLASKKYFGLPVPEEEPFSWSKIYKNYNIYLVFLFFLLAVVFYLSGKSQAKYFVLIGTIIYFGFWQINFISIIGLVNIFSGKIPDFVSSLPWYLLFILSLLSAIIWGRIYCGWICPFGAIQEFLGKLNLYVKLNSDSDKKARYIKYYLLILIVAAVFFTGNIGYTNYEPFTTIFAFKGNVLLWGFLAVLLLSSVFIYRFWCRYLCAVGAFFAIISNFSIYPVKAKKKCSLCKKCEIVCPVEICTIKEDVFFEQSECLQCNICKEQCPENVIGN